MHYLLGMSKNSRPFQLKVTERGQVTVRKEVLRHLGVNPGDKLELTLLPGGRAELHAPTGKQPISAIFGLLKSKTKKVATIEEIKEATGTAAAEAVMAGLRRK
jgi:bifunctional DNA-binding transcriptional regulator/antitoxin component of YhaV-PrlF toxin-antitoxin module